MQRRIILDLNISERLLNDHYIIDLKILINGHACQHEIALTFMHAFAYNVF